MLTAPAPLAATVEALAQGKSTLQELVAHCCDRIDAHEGQIQALLPERARRQRLLREATALEARFPHPLQRPPLFGALVGVKDILAVDGFPTQAGTSLPAALFAGPEAAVVTALRSAGALILGKTVTTEFAYFEPGPTRNPHDLAHTPGGSSSGSAAAVAAGFCNLALGSQTVGSVIRPAAFCGIIGLKPSFDRIPTAGLLYFSPSVDHIGLFTQDLAGMRLAARALCRGWRPPSSQPENRKLPRLGVPVGAYLAQTEPAALIQFESQLTALATAGLDIRRVPILDDIAAVSERHQRLIAAEFAQIHRHWFARYGQHYRPRTAALIGAGQQLSQADVEAGRASRGALRRALEAALDAHDLDLWIAPAATGPAPLGIEATGSPAMNLPWTHAGLPAVTLPAASPTGSLPLGLQLSARFDDDERLLAWAASLGRQVESQPLSG